MPNTPEHQGNYGNNYIEGQETRGNEDSSAPSDVVRPYTFDLGRIKAIVNSQIPHFPSSETITSNADEIPHPPQENLIISDVTITPIIEMETPSLDEPTFSPKAPSSSLSSEDLEFSSKPQNLILSDSHSVSGTTNTLDGDNKPMTSTITDSSVISPTSLSEPNVPAIDMASLSNDPGLHSDTTVSITEDPLSPTSVTLSAEENPTYTTNETLSIMHDSISGSENSRPSAEVTTFIPITEITSGSENDFESIYVPISDAENFLPPTESPLGITENYIFPPDDAVPTSDNVHSLPENSDSFSDLDFSKVDTIDISDDTVLDQYILENTDSGSGTEIPIFPPNDVNVNLEHKDHHMIYETENENVFPDDSISNLENEEYSLAETHIFPPDNVVSISENIEPFPEDPNFEN